MISDSAPLGVAPLRVFLADDHPLILTGLVSILKSEPNVEVVGYAKDGISAVQEITKLQQAHDAAAGVNVVVMDVQMAPGNGVKATAEIKRRWPRVKVVALSIYEDGVHLRAVVEAGASGYVLKRSASSTLVEAVRAVHRGAVFFDPALSPILIDSLLGKPTQRLAEALLTPREEEVMRLVARGYSNKEIAAQMSLSVKTVESYKVRSYQKLELDGRAEIMRYALTHGWLDNMV